VSCPFESRDISIEVSVCFRYVETKDRWLIIGLRHMNYVSTFGNSEKRSQFGVGETFSLPILHAREPECGEILSETFCLLGLGLIL